jgi:hypothetical protein
VHQSSEPKTARIPRCAKVTAIGWLQSARTLCGEFGTPPRANSGGMVGVRPLLTACGDPAVGSFALLALLAPVSEYGQVAIDTRAAESPRWSCTEDIFDRKHTVKVQSHLSQHVSVQLWRNTTPSIYRCQPLETDEVSYLGTALGSSMAFPLEAYFGPGGGAGPRRDESWSLFLIGGGGENTIPMFEILPVALPRCRQTRMERTQSGRRS